MYSQQAEILREVKTRYEYLLRVVNLMALPETPAYAEARRFLQIVRGLYGLREELDKSAKRLEEVDNQL